MPPPEDLALTLLYLTSHAMVESWEHGYAPCRFIETCTSPPYLLGCTTLTDGVFVWPEGLAHYVVAHGVVPPAVLVEAALESARTAARGAASLSVVKRNHLMWDASLKCAVPIPKGTREWLRNVSTLHMGIE